MLYSALTNAELERWVYASPNDGMALVELMLRGPSLLRQESAKVDDLEAEIAMQEDLRKSEVDAAIGDTLATEARLKVAQERVETLQTHMREITRLAHVENI
jgi:hypothetical protein